jgi:hypothetical protein
MTCGGIVLGLTERGVQIVFVKENLTFTGEEFTHVESVFRYATLALKAWTNFSLKFVQYLAANFQYLSS